MLGYIKRHRKLAMDFSKYFVIGLIFTIANVFFMWLLIDVVGLYSAVGATIVVVALFFGKFYTYVLTKFLRRHFFGYAAVNLVSMVLNVVLVWLFIEIFYIPTIYASATAVIILFIGRFIAFKQLGLIRE